MKDITCCSIFAILRLDGYDGFFIPRWMILTTVLILLSSITVWRLTIIVIRWWNRPCKSPHRLFRALCDRHQLNQSERAILQKMASDGPHDPNYLFIDPDLWVAKTLPPDVKQQRDDLFKKLFGQLPASS